MTDVSIVNSARSHVRTWLAVGGALSILLGVLVVTNPVKSTEIVAVVVAVALGVYAIVAGIAYFASAFLTVGASFWGRVLRAVAGAALVAAGVIIVTNRPSAAVGVVWFLVITIGVAWIIDGVTTFANLSDASSKGWAIFYAIVSILAGLVVIFSPLYSGLVMLLVLGITAIMWGVVQIVAAFRA